VVPPPPDPTNTPPYFYLRESEEGLSKIKIKVNESREVRMPPAYDEEDDKISVEF